MFSEKWIRRHLSLTSLALVAGLAGAANCQASSIPSLGTASNYAVLGLANSNINNSLVTINGNEGVSAGGTITNMAPSVVNGNVYQAAAGEYSGPGKLSGSVNTSAATLSQNDTDAATAMTAAEGLTATQTLAGISSDTTVTGNGGLNVIKVNGDITKSLTLNGTANDLFVVLVSGNVSLVGSDSLAVSGGVTPDDVLYVLTGSNGSVSTHVGDVVNGTLLGPNYSFNLDGTFNGEIIGGSAGIGLLSGAVVNRMPFTPPSTPPASAPEPSSMALLGSGLLIASVLFRRRAKARMHAPVN